MTTIDQQIAELVPTITADHEKQMLLELLQALFASQEATELLDESHDNVYRLAHFLGMWALGFPGDRLGLLERATSVNWPSGLTWLRHAQALYQHNRYEEAIPSYQKSIALNPDMDQLNSLHELQECYENTQKVDDGWLYFSQLTQERPDWWQAWYYRGVIGAKRDETISDETIASYLQTITLYHDDPVWIESSEGLKNYLEKHQAMTSGLELYIDLTQNYPDYWILWHNRAWFEMQNGDHQTALTSYRKAIIQHPQEGWYWSWKDLGEIYLGQSSFSKAVKAYSKAIEQIGTLAEHFDQGHAHMGRGNAYKQLEKFPEAIADYEEAVQSLYEPPPELYFSLGVCLEKNGQLTRAFASYRRSLQVDPDYAAAREAQETLLVVLRRKLLGFLDKQFNREDLRTLCFHLNVDYDNLPAEGKLGKARELITYQVRISGEDYIPLRDLITEMNAMRPDAPLP